MSKFYQNIEHQNAHVYNVVTSESEELYYYVEN